MAAVGQPGSDPGSASARGRRFVVWVHRKAPGDELPSARIGRSWQLSAIESSSLRSRRELGAGMGKHAWLQMHAARVIRDEPWQRSRPLIGIALTPPAAPWLSVHVARWIESAHLARRSRYEILLCADGFELARRRAFALTGRLRRNLGARACSKLIRICGTRKNPEVVRSGYHFNW